MQSTRTSSSKGSRRGTAASAGPRVPLRTCVGCGQEAPQSDLLRLVLAEQTRSLQEQGGSDPLVAPAERTGTSMDVVVDASGGTFGRGAHVHPQPGCLAKAERGLSRNFKRAVRAPAAALSAAIVTALSRRAESLLGSAFRLRKLEIGADAVKARVADPEASPVSLLVVACDAGSIAHSHEVSAAVAKGRAVAWSSRAQLGALLGRGEVAVFAMTDDRLATAFADAIQTMSVLSPASEVTKGSAEILAPSARAHSTEAEPQQWKGEACKSPEVR